MPRYLAHYTFEHTESSLRPKDQMYGQAKMQVSTDKPLETQEHLDDVSKYIFSQIPDCNKVIITALDEIVEDDSVIVGEVVE